MNSNNQKINFYYNINDINDLKLLNLKKPIIKSYDTRCSTKCVKNWTKYNQKPPIGHYCNCNILIGKFNNTHAIING